MESSNFFCLTLSRRLLIYGMGPGEILEPNCLSMAMIQAPAKAHIWSASPQEKRFSKLAR